MFHDIYSEWHTVTVEPDYEDDGVMVMSYELKHPASCPPPSGPGDPFTMYQCWTDDLIGEFRDMPEEIGLPTEPGEYRIRAWGDNGVWAGPHYIEPDSGIECVALSDAESGTTTPKD